MRLAIAFFVVLTCAGSRHRARQQRKSIMHRTLPVLGALVLILAASSGFGQDARASSFPGSLRAGEVDCAGHRRSNAQIYVREVVLAGTALRGRPAAGQRRAVRSRRRHAGGSLVRRSLQGLQLDGVSGEGGIRRLLNGHDRLRPLHAPAGDERSVQLVEGAAGAVRAAADRRAVRAVASDGHHDDGFGLERHRSGGRSPARAARRGQGVARRLVARRAARGRLCGAESRQGGAAGRAGACLQPRGPARRAQPASHQQRLR